MVGPKVEFPFPFTACVGCHYITLGRTEIVLLLYLLLKADFRDFLSQAPQLPLLISDNLEFLGREGRTHFHRL